MERVELLPYHLLGKHKWEAMGLRYTLEGVEPPPAGDDGPESGGSWSGGD